MGLFSNLSQAGGGGGGADRCVTAFEKKANKWEEVGERVHVCTCGIIGMGEWVVRLGG